MQELCCSFFVPVSVRGGQPGGKLLRRLRAEGQPLPGARMREGQGIGVQHQPRHPDAARHPVERIPADRGSVTSGGVSLPLQAVTEEEIEAIEEIIARTDHVLTVDNSLRGIIAEGAAGYLADQRSVDDAATQIQSRANLYVNEQRCGGSAEMAKREGNLKNT